MTLPSRPIRLVVVFAVVNLVLAVAGWLVLVSPQRHDAATAAAQELIVQSELAALTSTSSHGSTTPTQPAIHTADIYKLDTALPSQEDLPDLLFELDRLATASGVKVLGISPEAATATATGYTVQPIELQLTGTYFHLTGFLRSLRMLVSEQHGRLIANGPLVAVASVVYSPSTGHDEAATVGIQAFYYGVTGGATPPANTSTTDTTTTTGS